jgi:hypothetical protein
MKKLIAAIVIGTALTGCASIKNGVANFWLAKWDSNEELLVSQISVEARGSLVVCDPRFTQEQQLVAIGKLNSTAHQLLAYSQTLPDDNTPVITVMKNIADSTDEFYTRSHSKMSKVYCENKAKNIITMTQQAQAAVRSKRK